MAVLGIDVGGTNTRCVGADAEGRVLGFREARTPVGGVEALVNRLAELADGVSRDAGTKMAAAGVGFAGLIDSENGIVRYSPNLPSWREVRLAKMLGDILGMRVFLGNDANLAAIGEMWLGVGREVEDFLLVTLGTGVGSGVIIGGRPFWGASGYAAELGHVIVEPGGALCACGNRGCLEAYCSAGGLRRRLSDARRRGVSSAVWSMAEGDSALGPKELDKAAASGDKLARQLLTDAGKYLGVALATVANLLGIETVVVGGRMSKIGFDVLGTAQREANRLAMVSRIGSISVRRSLVGDRAGCLGACKYALDSMGG